MPLNLHDCHAGDLVAEKVFGPITRDMLIAYAEASGDSNPLHTDPEVAKKSGFDDVIIHGMLGMALLGNLLSETVTPSTIKRFSSRFVSIMPVDSRIVCRAVLSERKGSVVKLELEAALEGQSKTVITGSADIDCSQAV